MRRVVRAEELRSAHAIRLRVFVREQGVPRELELDAEDSKAAHFIAYVDRRAIGTARVCLHGSQAKVGRMAVLKRFRGHGAGTALLQAALRWANRKKAKRIFLHAQLPVVGFYEKRGFVTFGRVFVEAGIQHRKMVFGRHPKNVSGWRLLSDRITRPCSTLVSPRA